MNPIALKKLLLRQPCHNAPSGSAIFRISVWAFGLLLLMTAAPAFAQLSTNARTGRFSRGRGENPTYHSFLIPLDSQKGIALDDIGGNATNIFPQPYWAGWDFYHYNATNPASSSNLEARVHFENPIAAFGERVGGTPLYLGQRYHWGVYAGLNDSAHLLSWFDVRIYVWSRLSNHWVAVLEMNIPDYNEETNAWFQFGSNGYTASVSGYGLRTTAYRVPNEAWGVERRRSYIFTHEASSNATNYIFEVDVLGF
jgi:hypothetical protein